MKIEEIITLEQLAALRAAGFVVVHGNPNNHILGAMRSACQEFHDCDLKKAYHRAIAASISCQNSEKTGDFIPPSFSQRECSVMGAISMYPEAEFFDQCIPTDPAAIQSAIDYCNELVPDVDP